jgi:hypothetical protein
MLSIYPLPLNEEQQSKGLGIPEGNFGSLALAVTSRIQNPCRRQTMSHPKRIEPVENLSEQAGSQSTQRKILRLKSSDARIEKREPLPVQLYLASLDDPRARERTVTEDVSPHGARVLTKRYWQPGEAPLLTPLIGEFPKHARIVYCHPQPNGSYCVGIAFEGPSFKWHV